MKLGFIYCLTVHRIIWLKQANRGDIMQVFSIQKKPKYPGGLKTQNVTGKGTKLLKVGE